MSGTNLNKAMNRQLNHQENLSAAFDNESNELGIRGLLKTLNSDNQVDAQSTLKQWSHHQHLSDILHQRDTTYSESGIDFLSKINNRLETEIKPATLGQKFARRHGRILSQTAIAASVTLVAVLGVQQYSDSQQPGYAQSAERQSYAPTQFPEQFPVVVANSQPVSKRTWSQPINKSLATKQNNTADDASLTEEATLQK